MNWPYDDELMESEKTCTFPKHKGKLWVDVIDEDRSYVEWLVSGEGPHIREPLYEYLMGLLEG